MKKYVSFVLLACLTSRLFADAGKEIENFVKNDVNSKEFQQADELIKSLEERGSKLSKQGKYDDAMQCYQKALAQANSLYGKESTASALIYTSIGSLFLKKGDKLNAADNFIVANEIFKKSMGAFVKPSAAHSLLMSAGSLYFQANRITKAFKTLKQAEKNLDQLSLAEKVTLYRYLASCHFSMKQYNEAAKIYQKAVSLEANNCKDEMTVPLFELYDMLGLTYLELKQYANARFYYQKNISFLREKYGENNDQLAYDYLIIAQSYSAENQYEKAIKYFKKGIKILHSLNTDKEVIAIAYTEMACVFHKKKEKKLTLGYLKKAYKILTEMTSPNSELINLLKEKIKKLEK